MYIEFNKHCVGLELEPTKRYDGMMSHVTGRVFAGVSPPPSCGHYHAVYTGHCHTSLYTLYYTERGIIVQKQELFC